MISHIDIRNFQSLHHVSLELDRLTVIVGPTSSGKSAFTRAMRTLTSNKRGSDFITHGERITTITARTDKGTVSLKRGKGTADNEYVVIPDANPDEQRTYKKLSGETPQEVSDFLGIESKNPINYAGQFDKPYLLDDSAGEVARTLGALTNVNVIFEAAAESNRRKNANAATMRTRANDLEAITAKSGQYRALKGQRDALTEAEDALETARGLERRITRLSHAISVHELAEQSIQQLSPFLDLVVPDEQPIIQAAAKLTAYRAALVERQQADKHAAATTDALATVTTQLDTVEQEFSSLLGQLGEGILLYFTQHSKSLKLFQNTTIDAGEASQLAARYIAETLK